MSGRLTRRHPPSAAIAILPECQEMIQSGALFALNVSGGKDSQAMSLLVARIVPHDQFVAVHAPLGEVEWPGRIEHIESTIPDGVPLLYARTASGKSLLERIEERSRFPRSSGRFCTSDTKRGPIERELRRYLTRPRSASCYRPNWRAPSTRRRKLAPVRGPK